MENSKNLDPKLLRTMFNTIRSEEIKNIKTQAKDDKRMVKGIAQYINKKVEEEMEKDED